MDLSFTIAAGPRQRNHSQVRIPRDSLPHFTVSDWRLPQPVGPGPRIYNPQEPGGPVIPPGTGFPFRRLLCLVGLRWRYSTPPPHRITNLTYNWSSLHRPPTDNTENTSNVMPNGRAIDEAVSRWLPTAAARVQSRVWSSGICGGQSGVGAGFLRVLRFPLPFIPPISPSSQSPGADTIGQ
jgi:hypothetical protein